MELHDCSKVRIHICTVCGKTGKWGMDWSWFGSERDVDDGSQIVKACSERCKIAAKKKGVVPKNASSNDRRSK